MMIHLMLLIPLFYLSSLINFLRIFFLRVISSYDGIQFRELLYKGRINDA